MNLSIVYGTEYRYSETIYEQHDALRVKPAATPTQVVEDFQLRVTPEPKFFTHTDYFDTYVIEFGIHEPHDRMTVEARSRVSCIRSPAPPDLGWDVLGEPIYEDIGLEYLHWERERPRDGELQTVALGLRKETPLGTLMAVSDAIHSKFEYRPGATYVGSTVGDLIRAGAGVCQDFAHLALLLLRDEGIAARYVSGYLFAEDGEGGLRSIEVNTHAWIEALLPAITGEPVWVGVDPTNRCLVSDRHVKIGHGRYYSDIPPIKGVFRGAAESEHDVRVTMTRL